MLNDANVVLTDAEISNGVIHVINTVILPGKTPETKRHPDG
jgi:uncharacterized surface protein with fasciclin (FAS1) repeats